MLIKLEIDSHRTKENEQRSYSFETEVSLDHPLIKEFIEKTMTEANKLSKKLKTESTD